MLTGIENDYTPIDYDNLSDHIIAQMQTGHNPSTNPCILCCDGNVQHFKDCPLLQDDNFKHFKDCPHLQDDNFKTSFVIKMVTGVSKELRQGMPNLQTATAARSTNFFLTLHADTSPDNVTTPDFQPGQH
jgi:hypothetical protein